MKKVFLAGAMMALMCLTPNMKTNAASVNMQDDEVEQTQNGHGQGAPGDSTRRGKGRMDPAKMAEMRTNMMVKRYGLNDEQKAKVLALNKEQMTIKSQKNSDGSKIDPRNMTDEQRAAMKKEMQTKQEAYDAALKEILTNEQYQAYTKDKAKRKSHRGGQGNSENGGQNEGGPGEGGPGQGNPGEGGFGGGEE